MSHPPAIVFIGPLPPPLHGMAAVNADLLARLQLAANVAVFPVSPMLGARALGYHITKGLRCLRAVAGLVVARARGAGTLYASVDDGAGGLWTLLFVLAARAVRLRIFLHHHSYRYLVQRSWIIALLAEAGGPECRHVVLCDEMQADFARLYPSARHYHVAPNSVPAPPNSVAAGQPATPFTIGLLSNLMFEKGVVEFVEILEQAIADGIDVRGVVAGPAMGEDVVKFIRAKEAALGERLTWIGPVHAESKEAFFSSIHLFVFPTKYRTESFGLVLLEALVRGVPVVAPSRGCICVFAALEAATIVSLDDDFALIAREAVLRFASDEATWKGISRTARDQGGALNLAHGRMQSALVEMIVASAKTC